MFDLVLPFRDTKIVHSGQDCPPKRDILVRIHVIRTRKKTKSGIKQLFIPGMWFEEMGLTPGKSTVVGAPLIEESPLCIECRVKEVIALGSHDMFIADVVNVQADDRYLDPETGAFDMQKADLLAYSHGKYYGLGEFVGKFGWSVKKKK